MYSAMPKGQCILSILWLSFVSLPDCQRDFPCKKSIPLCYSFNTLIHSSYGELTIYRQKIAFCTQELETEQFQRQLSFNIPYTYMQLKVKKPYPPYMLKRFVAVGTWLLFTFDH